MGLRLLGPVLLVAAVLAACSMDTVSVRPSISIQDPNVEGKVPALFMSVAKELQASPVPVLVPEILPKIGNPGARHAIKVTTSADGYEIIIYEETDSSNKDGGITVSAMRAILSGKVAPDYRPAEEVMDGLKKHLKYSSSIVVGETPTTLYHEAETKTNAVPSNMVVWQEGNWLLTTQGEPNDIGQPIDQVPENTSIGLAQELLGLMKQLEGKEIKQGYISGQQAPKRTLHMEWTYDDRVWYSIDSPDWEYVFHAANRLIEIRI